MLTQTNWYCSTDFLSPLADSQKCLTQPTRTATNPLLTCCPRRLPFQPTFSSCYEQPTNSVRKELPSTRFLEELFIFALLFEKKRNFWELDVQCNSVMARRSKFAFQRYLVYLICVTPQFFFTMARLYAYYYHQTFNHGRSHIRRDKMKRRGGQHQTWEGEDVRVVKQLESLNLT